MSTTWIAAAVERRYRRALAALRQLEDRYDVPPEDRYVDDLDQAVGRHPAAQPDAAEVAWWQATGP
jgi:hypothetical protein